MIAEFPACPSLAGVSLVCPDCKAPLRDLRCPDCERDYPATGGIPVLLPSWSVFSEEAMLRTTGGYYAEKTREGAAKRAFRQRLPRVSGKPAALRSRISKMIASALATASSGVALQVGSGENPYALSAAHPHLRWVNSDVELGYRPDLVADVTGLPFPDASFEAVVAQQVLEHVYDPAAAAREMQRVLRPGGVLLVSAPFIYPLHGLPYDFQRFTPFGLRALFDWTEPIALCQDAGPWSALAVQLDSRLTNLFGQRHLRGAALVAGRFLFSWMKHLDRFALSPRHQATAASFLYLGRKLDRQLHPRQVMAALRNRPAV